MPRDLATIKARSPVNSIATLRCPLIQFQGLEDKVVPPNQAEEMFEAVKAKGIPTAAIMFEGEQHGFRAAANIRRALDTELEFYGKVFGFSPELPAGHPAVHLGEKVSVPQVVEEEQPADN